MANAFDSTIFEGAEVLNGAASSCNVTFIDPLEEPQAYGADELLADLRNIRHIQGVGPDIGADLENALRERDYTSAEFHLRSVKDWFRKHDNNFVIMDQGQATAQVPLLVASAPDVPDTSVVVAQEEAEGAGFVTSLMIAGTGLGTSAKLDVTDATTLTCSPGEVLVATISVPVQWERRADPGNEDNNWTVAHILQERGQWPIGISKLAEMPDATVLNALHVDTQGGGVAPAEVSKKYSIETGADFTFGLKIDAIGLDTSLKITAEASMSISLDATLPTGKSWDVSWLAGPWGARLTAS